MDPAKDDESFWNSNLTLTSFDFDNNEVSERIFPGHHYEPYPVILTSTKNFRVILYLECQWVLQKM